MNDVTPVTNKLESLQVTTEASTGVQKPSTDVVQLTKEVTKDDVYNPTPTMLIWLDVAIQIRSDSPSEIVEACRQMGTSITRQAWYDWKKDPKFLTWFYTQWRQRRSEWIGELDAIGMKMSKKGDYNFWRDMNKKAGEFLGEKETMGASFKDGDKEVKIVVTRGS